MVLSDSKSNAIRIHEHGGPDVLRWEQVTLPPLEPGHALLRQTAIGLNYIDLYFREGLYEPGSLPFVPGMEGAGTIEEIREPAHGFSVGDRVAYPHALGAYAQRRVIPTADLVPLPGGIDDVSAAALMLKGLTARYLLKDVHPVRRRDVILIHAVAGGVGSILCQWARRLGATIIGTAGSDDKVSRAAELGCDHPINYAREDFVERVRGITAGSGVDVVYDGVGKATFDRSLQCLKEQGLMVSFGNASGLVPPVKLLTLAERALYLTRPSLKTFLRRPGFLEAASRELFEAVRSGAVKVDPIRRLPLTEAAAAHRELESRRTVGATVLIP